MKHQILNKLEGWVCVVIADLKIAREKNKWISDFTKQETLTDLAVDEAEITILKMNQRDPR